jgi:arabinose-5-phosphate isomerase
VDEVLRPLAECRVAHAAKSVRDVFIEVSRPGRRTGAIMLVDDRGALAGIFTDSDLARLLEQNREACLDGPIREVMTRAPRSVQCGSMMSAAIEILSQRKISELPVIDAEGRPVGMIDITDLVGWLPVEPATEKSTQPAESPSADGPLTVPFLNPKTGSERT